MFWQITRLILYRHQEHKHAIISMSWFHSRTVNEDDRTALCHSITSVIHFVTVALVGHQRAVSHSAHCPIISFHISMSLSPETSDRRVPLLRAAGEQQLQHLLLQEVPQHVRGTEADWPVQVWKQNWTGSEGHSFSSNVGQILIWDLGEIY